jgi:hypothetical protein
MSQASDSENSGQKPETLRVKRREPIVPPDLRDVDGRPRFVAEVETPAGGNNSPAANPSAGIQEEQKK